MMKRWIGTALLMFACLGSYGVYAQTASEKAEIIGIANIAFRVSDLDREVSFLGKLGFEEAFTTVADGRIDRAFIKINDKQFIELYPQTDLKQPLGLVHVCYESDALKALNAKYVAEGLKPTPAAMGVTGNLLFSLLDPDGREIHFAQYMPGSRHVNDRGQHLGAGRVSDQLMGLEESVRDMNASKTFAASLGFDAENEGQNVRLSVPANPDLTVILRPAHVGDVPQFLFPVEDARKAADVLKGAGLKVERHDKLDIVRDPDGNTFVLMQTEQATKHRSINLTPWRHKADEQ